MTRTARRRRAVGLFGALVCGAAALAGCGYGGTAVTTPFVPNHIKLEHGRLYVVKAAPVAGLGTVLVDGLGITLYLYATDHRGQPSRCYDLCAIQWPPYVLPPGVTAPVAGPGVRPGLLGTAPRRDGTTQVTYNGWPLYLWPGDRAPGMATGQALTNAGGLWYVLTPDGSALTTRH